MKLIALLFLLSTIAYSQERYIDGTVTDTKGSKVPGVNVILRNTSFGAATDQDGYYKITNLEPGTYTIEFSALGYRKEVRRNIILKNNALTLNITLTEEAVQTEQIIVTASKHDQLLSELPVSAEVISENYFSSRNITNLETALRFVPGVNLTDDQISIRGSSGYSRGAGSRVLLAIDGIPFYTGDTGETIWEIIPVADIQRVEIIKGAASSLYGSTAIGGVINVITKPVSNEHVTYFRSIGGFYDKPSFDEWDWSDRTRFYNGITLGHSGKLEGFGITASITRLESDGYKRNNHHKKYIGYLKGHLDLSPTSSVSLLVNTLNKRSGSFLFWKDSRNALVPQETNSDDRVSTNRYLFGVIYKNVLSDDLLLNVKSSYYRTNWSDNGVPLNESTTNLFRGEVQVNYSLSSRLFLVSGIEASGTDVTSTLFGNRDAISGGAYVQAELNFDFPLILSFGARYDYSRLDSLKGSSAVSPKLGINYHFSPDLVFRSSLGTGFRAPSLAEAFTSTSSGGITVKPNPDLQSEKNFTVEAGLNYQLLRNLALDLAAFQNEFYDFIEASVDPSDGLVFFSNVTRARIQGVEAQVDLELFDKMLKFKSGYTYLWSRDLQKKKALKYRPRHILYTSVEGSISNISLGADLRFWSRVENIDDELSNFIKDANKRVVVYVLDLRTGYSFNFGSTPVKLWFNANNVFNYNYIELVGNLAPIRNFSLSLELIF